jgi:hypothetical protein
MRKAAIIAVVALGSTIALYAGINQATSKKPDTKTECCSKAGSSSRSGNVENCCIPGCD